MSKIYLYYDIIKSKEVELMRRNKFIIMLLLLTMIFNTISFAEGNNEDVLNIIFTHDLHDHIEDFNTLENNEIINIGGYERLNNKIKKEREKDQEILVLDGGDYSMGTLFQTIYGTESPSLRLFGEIGVDVTTFGNHEFDFRARGLIDSLLAAKNSGDKLPEIVMSNIDFEDYSNVDEDEVKEMEDAFNKYGVKDYTVLEKKGYKIGVFGVIGKDAISNAPMAGVNFKDYIESAKRVTKILREEEKVDLVIALSHSGTWEDSKKSEDEILAKEVKDIDLIISGHTHTKLDRPIMVDNTIIVSSGRYTENIGKLKIEKDGDHWIVNDYLIEPLRDEIGEKSLETSIDYYKTKVQEEYLDDFNLGFNQILGHTSFNFTPANEIGKFHGEDPLANLISDSFIHMVKKIEGDNYEKITASIVPSGTIRDSFTKGTIRVSDVFNANSLGIGPDGISGYPLVDVYLTGEDLKTAAEVDASIAPIMDVAQLYMSGVSYTFNPNRLIFNKLTDMYIIDDSGEREEIDDKELYRIVAGLYTGQMLSIVKDQSFGLMSIVPRDKDGNAIEDFEDHIIYDGSKEVKEWYAVADYIDSFDKVDGLAEVPDKYSKPEGRKIIDSSRNLKAIFMKPNKLAQALYVLLLVIILLLILIIRYIFIRRRSRKNIRGNR